MRTFNTRLVAISWCSPNKERWNQCPSEDGRMSDIQAWVKLSSDFSTRVTCSTADHRYAWAHADKAAFAPVLCRNSPLDPLRSGFRSSIHSLIWGFLRKESYFPFPQYLRMSRILEDESVEWHPTSPFVIGHFWVGRLLASEEAHPWQSVCFSCFSRRNLQHTYVLHFLYAPLRYVLTYVLLKPPIFVKICTKTVNDYRF